jgi:hypothetical protein
MFPSSKMSSAEGDRIKLTRNDPLGWTNGTAAVVEAINPLAREAQLRLDDGRSHTLALHSAQDQHWRHGYVETAYGA